MLDVAAAREIVLRHAHAPPAESIPLSPPAVGRILAEPIRADMDSPPFDKAMMDGYAVRASDCARRDGAELRVVGEVAAGGIPTRSVEPGEAVAVYTGAPLPGGADAVVMKERVEVLGPDRIRVHDPNLTPGKNVLERGREMKAGEAVLPIGTAITPAVTGLLAAVGRSTVSVYPVPLVGVLATGNELVEAHEVPGPGRIRNSNGPMLAALVERAGANPRVLGIAPDDPEQLRVAIRHALATTDLLILAGGVSVGRYDRVPDVLAGLGVQIHFHKVRMKPGKPLLFGTLRNRLVFGLPGNPVSAFVCFELFVRPVLRKLGGDPHPMPATIRLPIADEFRASHDRPTYHPAKLIASDTGWQARGLPWFGSADLRGLASADALLVLPAGDVHYQAGQPVEVMLI
jgi:molybdopterin molybdotransferase